MPTGQGGSPFDLIENSMMSVVFAIMGYKAEWTPSAGGPMQTATVGYKDPTGIFSMKNTNYTVTEPTMEYKFGDFDGLDAAVARTSNVEEVKIYFTASGPSTSYYVRDTKAKYDGKVFLATLELNS